MRKLVILRPEPGASASAARARSLGIEPLLCPLFKIEPVAWKPPDPSRFDALLLTSANAMRHGGGGLTALTSLPVIAVGETTAAAARDRGFTIASVGDGGIESVLRTVQTPQRLLHLCGRDHVETASPVSKSVPVYAAEAMKEPGLPALSGTVVAVHSPRAGARLAELIEARSSTSIAAISEAAAMACGLGWQAVEWPATPNDAALLALAARLCQSPRS